MKKYKKLVLNEQQEIDPELEKRIYSIIETFKNETFTNYEQRKKFAMLIMELVLSSKDIKVRELIKRTSKYLTEIADEILNR